MTQDSELSRLERFVEKLLVSFSELREEKHQLLKDVAERDSLIEELRGNIASQDSERSEISLRVNTIVDQIEEWEKSLDDEVVAESDNDEPTAEDDDDDEEETEAEEETGEAEDEGRVQHNLFSMENS